jgi:two-component system sensor histidine kinase TctE
MASESLRFGLLLRLATLLLVVLLLDAFACYYTALHFANLVYDRWLIDSGHSLATAVRAQDGHIVLDLPRSALDVFQFDEVDTTYYRIDSTRQGLVAGERALRPAAAVASGKVSLSNSQIGGRRVRVVSIPMSYPLANELVTISVAETLIKRSALTREVLLAMTAPQIALLAIGLALAWVNVNRGLKPLTDLANQIEARDLENLTPFAEHDLPKEAHVLVKRLNELLARVRASVQSQENFVADAAHQLRTPLAALMLHADAAERAADVEAQRRAVRGLRASAERAARLSRQLLLLMRAGRAAAAAAHLNPVDLSSLVRRIGEEWVPQMLARGVDFGLAVPSIRVPILADGALLGELLSNLLDNAHRYGRTSGRVTLGVVAAPTPTLYVEDDGPGIDPAEQTHIFERFYRAPGTPGEGCGLGLAIVKEIADLHRAHVHVHSDGQLGGTRVSVVFERGSTLEAA